MEKFKIGDRVEHQKLGKGTVESLSLIKGHINIVLDKNNESWSVLTSNLTKIEETKEMTSYKVGDIVEHPLYNECIIIDISRFESGHIEIVPLTGLSRGLPILVRINNVKHADNKLIISIEDYNEMANTIEHLKKEKTEMQERLYVANDKVRCAEAKLAMNSIFGYNNLPEVKEVLYHKPATIIFWKDGTKTVVKAQEKEKYDKEKGFVMAYLKKILGNEGNYYEVIKRWTEV